MPILLWPFPTGAPTPPPIPQVALTGKIVVINSVNYTRPIFAYDSPLGNTYQAPNLGESCALIFYVGGGLPTIPAPVMFTFIRPDGSAFRGTTELSFIGSPGASYYYNFPTDQYVVYLFQPGELNQRGVWQVSVTTTGFISDFSNFIVV